MTHRSPTPYRRAPLFALIALQLVPLAVQADDLRQLLPAAVPPQVEAPATTASAPTSSATLPPPPTGTPIFIDDLKGLAFFPSAEAAAAGVVGPGYQLSGVAPLDSPEFRTLLDLFLHQPVYKALLDALADGTRAYLNALGYPFSVVYLPEQEITDGVVRVVVLLARPSGAVEVEGAHYFDPALYREALRIDPQAPINATTLREDVAWLNRNPFRAVTIDARRGAEPATTQLVLQVREARPRRLYLGGDNSGTRMTQENRLFAGANWGNAFGLGHQASLQLTTSEDGEALQSLSGAYSLDLPWRHTLAFTAAYSRTEALVAPPFSLAGESWQIAADYTTPLRTEREGYSHQLSYGLDVKSSDNNFAFATIPISDNLTHILQARITYAGSLQSAWGTTGFDATLTASPGGADGHNDDAYFDQSRSGATADYAYLHLGATHQMPLDGLASGMRWQLRAAFQSASANLLGSEQFQGGGSNSVRGYEDGEVYADSGVLLSHELHAPVWAGSAGRLDPFLFQDYARLWNVDPLPSERTVELHSLGLGLGYQWGNTVDLRAAYGWQLKESGSSDSGDDHRAHLTLRVSY